MGFFITPKKVSFFEKFASGEKNYLRYNKTSSK